MSILLLEKGCQNCAYVKVALNMEKAEDTTFVGKNGEKIFVFFSSNDEGTSLFTQKFGMTQDAPILKLEDGKEITKVDEIIKYLKVTGYYKA